MSTPISSILCVSSANSGNGTPLGAASASALQAGTGSWTVGAFVKLNSLPTTIMPLVSKWNNGVNGGQEYMLFWANGPGTFSIIAGDAGGTNAGHELDGSIKPVAGSWYFVVATYDSSAALLHLYVNNVADGTPLACPSVLNGTTAFRVGGAVNSTAWAMDGSIAMAFKYQGLISSANQTWLYNNGIGRTTASILAQTGLTTPDFLYGFDNPAALGTDSSANALTLTSVNATAPTQAAGPPGLATVLVDGFVGTAGASVTNRTPDTTQYLTQTWGGIVPANGGDAMVIASGGIGATSSGASGPPWSEFYPLTGLSSDYNATFTWTNSSSSAVPTVFLRLDSGGTNFLALDFHYGNSAVYLSKMVSGTYTGSIAAKAFTFATGTTYTAVASLVGTSFSLTLNGQSIFTGQVVPAAVGSGVAIRQQAGAAGNTVFTKAEVQADSATAVTITGPSAITTGSASTNFTATLNAPAPDGGLVLTPTATGFTSTFTPASVTIAVGLTTGTFTATSSTAGSGTVSAKAPGGVTVTGASVTSSAPASPTTCTVTGPSTITDGIPATFTFTLNTPAPTGGTSIVPAVTGFSATFGTNPIVIAAGSSSGTTTVNASTVAAGTVTGTSSGLTFTAASTTAVAPASSYTLTAPSPASGTVGVASGNFTLQANGVPSTTLVVTPSDGSSGTFTPATVTISDAVAHTFTYTPASSGSKVISVTHTGGSGISADPASVAYTANAATATVSYQTAAVGFASGLVGGTTVGFGYKLATDLGSFGALVTTGIVEDSPGYYTAIVHVILGSIPRVRWFDGSGGDVTDYSPLAVSFNLNLLQAGLSPRDLGALADGSLTVGDALVSAVAAAAGKESITGTSYTVKTPFTGTVIRTFTLDSATSPTSRN